MARQHISESERFSSLPQINEVVQPIGLNSLLKGLPTIEITPGIRVKAAAEPHPASVRTIMTDGNVVDEMKRYYSLAQESTSCLCSSLVLVGFWFPP
jgi:hypothetical protein